MSDMVFTENVRSINKSLFKVEPKEEDVEIVINDVFNSLDEENVPQLKSENVTGRNELDNNLIKWENKQEGDESAGNNLQSEETLTANFTKDLGDIRKPRRSCNKDLHCTDIGEHIETTDYLEDKNKVIITKAPLAAMIVEPHEYTKLNENNHICNYCQLVIKNKNDLKKHIRRIHRDITIMYQCPYCSFKSKWNLKQHILLTHKKEEDIKWFKCHICDVKLKTKAKITKHIYTHLSSAQLGDLMKSCSLCQKKFKTSGGLSIHIRFVHNKEPKRRLQCEECDYNIVDASSMRKHVEIYHTRPEQRRTHECEKCDYKTTYEYKFKAHFKQHEKQYCCEKCAFVGTSIASFKLHQITHETEVNLKYQCDKCNYKTYRHNSFYVHKLNHLKPDEIRYFYCYLCNSKMKRKNNLRKHIMRHFKKQEVVLECFVCDFKTKTRNLLTSHLKKHSELKIEPERVYESALES